LARSEEKVGVEEKEVERGRPSTVILLLVGVVGVVIDVLRCLAAVFLCFEDL